MNPVRDNRALTRSALCLAVASIVQALRVILPLPPIASMLLIGTVVNLCLCFAVWGSGILYAGIICLLLPLFAFLQGHLPLLPMVAVVFLGNPGFLPCCAAAETVEALCVCAIAESSDTVVLHGHHLQSAPRTLAGKEPVADIHGYSPVDDGSAGCDSGCAFMETAASKWDCLSVKNSLTN